MRIRMFHLLLVAGILGCDRTTTSPLPGSAIKDIRGHALTNDVNGVQNRENRVEAEQVLGRNLRKIPFSRRYDAVLKKAGDLWDVLDGMMPTDAYYVILASARFQKEIEDELNSTIPERPKGKEMSSVSKGGVQYRVMAKDEAEDFMRRSREVAEKEEYRCQLRHFLSCYPQRLDSTYIRTAIERMPSDRRKRLVVDIERILGRNIMLERGNDAQTNAHKQKVNAK